MDAAIKEQRHHDFRRAILFAVDNGIDWLTHTFGNGSTAHEVERSGEKRRAVMSRLGAPCGR
jgi:hypothetical protein